MVTPPDETAADPYAVIAALRAERDAALAREAKRDSDYLVWSPISSDDNISSERCDGTPDRTQRRPSRIRLRERRIRSAAAPAGWRIVCHDRQ